MDYYMDSVTATACTRSHKLKVAKIPAWAEETLMKSQLHEKQLAIGGYWRRNAPEAVMPLELPMLR